MAPAGQHTTKYGLAALRISESNWATSEEDVAISADAILRVYAHRALSGSRVFARRRHR